MLEGSKIYIGNIRITYILDIYWQQFFEIWLKEQAKHNLSKQLIKFFNLRSIYVFDTIVCAKAELLNI